ncbi:MAG: metal ABC transporter substrate-binding protein [Puniceicoccales bacterium]|nr:metal ABC transporter substrate-binding protein [Puniceicoccales bacterium]
MNIRTTFLQFTRAMSTALALAAGFACAGAAPAAFAAPNVVATTADLGAIAHAVCGTDATVSILARPGEDPHFVDARPSFLRVLNKADLLIEGGADLEEGWLPPLVNNARNAKIHPGASGRFAAAAEARIALRDVPVTLDRSMGDVHAHGNPHFLLSPANAALVARALAARMALLDPANADAFRARAARFAADIETRVPGWKTRLSSLRGANVITYHRSFDYMLDVFGMRLAGTIEPKPGIEPSGTHIVALIEQARNSGTKLILVEPSRPSRLCERVAHGTGAPLARIPLMPDPPNVPDAYIRFFESIVTSMEKALPPSRQ